MSTLSSKQLVYFFRDQINKVRKNPQSLISHLKNRVFINNTFQFAHCLIPNVHYKTLQGPLAVQEAIHYLNLTAPLKQLVISSELCQAAFLFGQQIIKNKITNPQQQMAKIDIQLTRLGVKNYGETLGIIQYGFRKDPQIVPLIIVNDGDKTRYNRNVIMSSTAKYLGISVHEHQEYDYMLIILVNQRIQSERGLCQCTIF